MVGKLWSSGILQWKIFCKKEGLKLRKMKMIIFSFLCKEAAKSKRLTK